MTTRKKATHRRKYTTPPTPRAERSKAMAFLEDLAEGPLTLGGLMRAIREGEGWSLAEMGKQLGASRGYISNIENGIKTVSPKTAAKYAELLGYSPDQFVRLALQDIIDRAGMDYTVKLARTG